METNDWNEEKSYTVINAAEDDIESIIEALVAASETDAYLLNCLQADQNTLVELAGQIQSAEDLVCALVIAIDASNEHLFNELFDCAPSLDEAHDLLMMEQMARSLGFDEEE